MKMFTKIFAPFFVKNYIFKNLNQKLTCGKGAFFVVVVAKMSFRQRKREKEKVKK